MITNKHVLTLVIIGFLIYFNSLFSSFVWDDEEQILNNTLVHSITNISQFFSGSTFNTGGSGRLGGLYYKPLMSICFSIIYTFFGAVPFFFHLFQVILHISNAILIFLFFGYFFKKSLSLILAIIFLVHPINVETVSYISALQDTLFLFFGMLALNIIQREITSIVSKALLILLLIFSLLSKETGFIFLVILPFFALLFERKKFLSSIISSIAAFGFYLFLRLGVAQIYWTNTGPSPVMKTNFLERAVNAPQIILFYLKTFFFPKDLAIAQHWLVKSTDFHNFYLPLIIVSLFFAVLALWGIFLYKNNKKNFGIFVFFFIWQIAGIGLHLQIIPLDMTVAERWFYFPIIGILGIIGTIIQKFYLKGDRLPAVKIINGAVLLAIIIIFSLRTIIRNTNWQNGPSLYSHDIKISKNAFDLENNLGVEFFRVGRYGEAKIHFENSIQLAPHWWTNWNNLGVIYEKEKDFQKAEEFYQKSINNGEYFLAYENLAKLMLFHQDAETARNFCRKALKKLPSNSNLWLMLALSEYRSDNKDAALKAAKNSYQLSPNQQNSYVYQQLSKNLPLNITP